jgi:hypothetical protein
MNLSPSRRRGALVYAFCLALTGIAACSDDTEVTGSTLASADGTALGDAQGTGDAADDQQAGQDVEAPDAATVTDIGPAPDGAEPDSASDGSVDPDAVDPDAVGVDSTDLDVAGPDSDQPDATQPDTAIPDAGVPDTTQPDTTQPDATQPDTTQPDTAAPDVAFDAGPPGPVCAGAADCPAINNPCVQAICTAGKCSTAPKADGTVCAASSDPCKSDGVCTVGSCGAQIAKSCDDGNACTTDSCLPGKGCAWSPTTAACDDGNPCTAGEVCGVVAGKGVVCQGGKPVDGAAACDDKNACTTDSCDVAKGCIHTGKVGTPCDDGSACTSGETCQASGACQPAGGPECDDGNPCTKDSCDTATKLCNFVPQNGIPCDDGQLCTSGDACGNGKCAGKAIACNDNNPCTGDVCDPATGKCAVLANTNGLLCDDGSACTAKDACLAGKCTGSPVNCSDGNDCTDDLCDTKTGACTFLANTAPCTGAVACLTGGQCKDGKCQAGTKPNCDDGSPCTSDACDSATGKCAYTKAADGTVCDDGVACSTSSACQSGACVPSAPCLVLANNSFDCGKASGWSFDPPLSTQDGAQVVWSVDNNPGVDGMTNNGGCALNYNDGDNYCAKAGNGCIGTHGKATSPNLDFTKTGGLTPLVTMDTYYEVDLFNTANPPKVLVIDVASGKELGVVSLPFGQGDINKVKTGLQLALPMAQGKIVKLQLVLGAPVGDGGVIYDGGNQGNGWYVDNLKVEAAYKPEICGDGIDNNCNGEVDSADRAGCSRPMHDRCDDALDVSAGGRFTVGLAGALGDYPSRCAGNTVPPRDAILRLRLDAPRDVALTAEASGASVLVQLGTRCGELEGVRDCVLGYPTVYRTRALPAGEYFFQIATTSAVVGTGDVAVTVELSDPTPTPANDACAGAIDLVPGIAARGTLVDVADDVLTSCGGTTPDLVYRLTLTERRDVTLRASGARADYLTLSLVDTCARSPTTLRCGNGGPAQLSLRNLAPGTYYVVVEGTRVRQFTLEAELTAPTTAVPGDACANPIVIAPNSTVMGTVNGAQGDVPISCYGGDSRDLVYRFTLDRTLDVNAVLRGGASDFFFMAVQRTCASAAGEVACRYGTVGRLTARGLDPGEYFLVVRPLRGTDFTLTLAASPPLAPVMAAGNDTCATAQAIPSGGGFYLGNTASLRRDYTAPCTLGTTSEDAVFRYRSDVRQRVQVSLEGSSFNTVVWMTQGPMCPGSSVPLTCYSGEGAAPAVFDTLLDPGEYWIYVSGFNAEARGAYSLSVLPLPM